MENWKRIRSEKMWRENGKKAWSWRKENPSGNVVTTNCGRMGCEIETQTNLQTNCQYKIHKLLFPAFFPLARGVRKILYVGKKCETQTRQHYKSISQTRIGTTLLDPNTYWRRIFPRKRNIFGWFFAKNIFKILRKNFDTSDLFPIELIIRFCIEIIRERSDGAILTFSQWPSSFGQIRITRSRDVEIKSDPRQSQHFIDKGTSTRPYIKYKHIIDLHPPH